MQKNWFKGILTSVFVLGLLTLAPAAMADPEPPCGNDPADPLGLNCVEGSKLTNNDPRLIATGIINVVLGVLGTIATVLIFYAGFLWMTAAGNEDNVTKAKTIMSAAVIGLVIILAAYSISSFVIKSATKAINTPSAT